MNQFSRQTNEVVSVFMTAGLAVLLLVLTAGAEARQTAAPQPAGRRVLFMCPHGAAKSVLASAYFRRLAKERGLNVEVDSAGTEPDPVWLRPSLLTSPNRVTQCPPRSLA